MNIFFFLFTLHGDFIFVIAGECDIFSLNCEQVAELVCDKWLEVQQLNLEIACYILPFLTLQPLLGI